jgi:hypothetical protein
MMSFMACEQLTVFPSLASADPVSVEQRLAARHALQPSTFPRSRPTQRLKLPGRIPRGLTGVYQLSTTPQLLIGLDAAAALKFQEKSCSVLRKLLWQTDLRHGFALKLSGS